MVTLKHLQISDTFSLPPSYVAEKGAFLGRTGSGKTFAAGKCAELLLENDAQIIALDPVGCWYGLRVGGSFQLYIFGGLHGDYPLEPTGGKLMADLISDRGLSAVLDVSQFTRSEQIRFSSDFIELELVAVILSRSADVDYVIEQAIEKKFKAFKFDRFGGLAKSLKIARKMSDRELAQYITAQLAGEELSHSIDEDIHEIGFLRKVDRKAIEKQVREEMKPAADKLRTSRKSSKGGKRGK